MDQSALTFHLSGQLDCAAFPIWMARQAHKLAVEFEITQSTGRHMTVSSKGALDLVEAFALTCSLGPQSVYVETLEMDWQSND